MAFVKGKAIQNKSHGGRLPMKHRNMIGSLLLFFAFTLAGTSVVAARFLTGHLGTFTITAVSLMITMLFLLPFRLKKLMQTVKRLGGRDFVFLGVQALFGIFLFRLFLLNGLTLTSSAEAGILTSAAPAMTAVMAVFFLKERPTMQKMLGIGLTVLGVLLVQWAANGGGGLKKEHLWGNVLVILAAACEALFNIFSKAFFSGGEHSQREHMDPAVQTILVSFMAMVLCMLCAVGETPLVRLAALPFSGWLALLWYGIFVTALSYICWFAGIARCGVLTAAAFSGMMPLIAAALSILVLKEALAPLQLLGGLCIMGGMVWLGVSASGEDQASAAA